MHILTITAEGDYVIATTRRLQVALNPVGSIDIHGLGGMSPIFKVCSRQTRREDADYQSRYLQKSAVEQLLQGVEPSPAPRC